MKKILLLVLLVAFTGIQLDASATSAKKKKRSSKSKSSSELRFGVKAGLNIANMAIKDASPSPGSRVGFLLGGTGEYNFNESAAVEAGLLLSTKGCKSDVSVEQSYMGMTFKIKGTSTISPTYLEIPINFLYKIPVGDNALLLAAGPYLGMGVGGKIKGDYTVESNIPGFDPSSLGYSNENAAIKYGSSQDDNLKAMDFGLNIGAGFEFSNIQVRVQYGLGLSNISPVSEGDFKNKVLGITLGYMFGN